MARLIQIETPMASKITKGSTRLQNITANTTPIAIMLKSFTRSESS